VVREVEAGKSQAQIAREPRISQNLISCVSITDVIKIEFLLARGTPTLTMAGWPPWSGWSAA
jgi:hypothetical protein